MEIRLNLLVITCLISLFLGGCITQEDAIVFTTPEPVEGELAFTLGFPTAANGRALADCDAAIINFLSVTINEDDNGRPGAVVFDSTIQVYQFDSVTQSEKIFLPVGTYRLTKMEAYTSLDLTLENLVAFVPSEEDDISLLVDQAVEEITFEVEEFTLKTQDVTLLCPTNIPHINQIGIVNFDLELVDILRLCFFANYCDPVTGDRVANVTGQVYEDFTEEELLFEGTNNPEEGEGLLCLYFPDSEAPDCFWVVLTIEGKRLDGFLICEEVINAFDLNGQAVILECEDVDLATDGD